jgi:NAD(P)-dependent dehydrogenase (short-subunit alcohol dehydrogenase family)
VAYKATKAGMIAFTHQVAIQNAEFARERHPAWIDRHTDGGRYARPRQRQKPGRDRGCTRCPGPAAPQDGTPLFLASDEANFITGVALPVDGGALVDIN